MFVWPVASVTIYNYIIKHRKYGGENIYDCVPDNNSKSNMHNKQTYKNKNRWYSRRELGRIWSEMSASQTREFYVHNSAQVVRIPWDGSYSAFLLQWTIVSLTFAATKT